ncbi:MAG: LysR family transcriptional regulator [Silicimonas sp.]|nr:LysR family transcriptional regulator [Silicimonas sp.]
MSALQHLDWSLVQTFLSVAETGSLSAAARRLGLTQPTVGRHIQTLEQDLGVALFKRQARGMALTDQGAALLGHAGAMREAAEALRLNASGRTSDLSGTVRITASVFSSQYYLPPLITELRETLPDIQIELVPNDASDNLLFGEADIAVRMYRPTQLDMVTVHVGDIQLGLFASQSYIRRKGFPIGAGDMMDHDFVGYDRNEEMVREFNAVGFNIGRDFFPVRCDNQTVVWELIRAGAGLGFGPVLAGRRDAMLEQIEIDVPLPRLGVWLTAHEAVRRAPRVDAVWQLLAKRLAATCDA